MTLEHDDHKNQEKDTIETIPCPFCGEPQPVAAGYANHLLDCPDAPRDNPLD